MALAIFIVMMTLVLAVVQGTTRTWQNSTSKIEAFQDARNAFQMLTRNLGQATLNPYYDYYDASGLTLKDTTNTANFVPRNYGRQSELKFLLAPSTNLGIPGSTGFGQAVFFQSPLSRSEKPADYGGLSDLLNVCGYFIQYDSSKNAMEIPPHAQTASDSDPHYRYRLMQMVVPTEDNKIYEASGTEWYSDYLSEAQVASENVLALILTAQYPGGSSASATLRNYTYDSTANVGAYPQPPEANQLPPVVLVTMVAIDENSARRIATSSPTQPTAITSAFQGLFEDASKYQEDIESLKETLSAIVPKIQYRIFSSAVSIQSSKWSSQ